MNLKNIVPTVIASITIACFAIIIFLPYRHISIHQQEITLTVGTDIVRDQIRANAPFVIKLDNSYQAKVEILSPHQIDLTYDGETIKSVSIKDNFSSFQQIIEYQLPVVRGEMSFGSLPKNTQIRLTSDNSYFEVVVYKPIEYLYSDVLLFIIFIICITSMVYGLRQFQKVK